MIVWKNRGSTLSTHDPIRIKITGTTRHRTLARHEICIHLRSEKNVNIARCPVLLRARFRDYFHPCRVAWLSFVFGSRSSCISFVDGCIPLDARTFSKSSHPCLSSVKQGQIDARVKWNAPLANKRRKRWRRCIIVKTLYCEWAVCNKSSEKLTNHSRIWRE